MKKQNLLTIWAKRAIPALALAAMLLPACEKPVEQHDVTIPYYNNNNGNTEYLDDNIIRGYANDKLVRNIYITVMPGEIFTNLVSDDISARRRVIQGKMAISPKIRGRGNFVFTPGDCMYGDSLDFVAMGFTVNKQNQH